MIDGLGGSGDSGVPLHSVRMVAGMIEDHNAILDLACRAQYVCVD